MPGKHALLIGIDRYSKLDESKQLRGCVNDVRLLARILAEKFEFPPEGIFLVCDEQATAAGIREAMQALLGRVGASDSVVFAYSGHGSQFKKDSNRPEDWDECLVPSDSGRDSDPVLDIPDDDVNRWLHQLSQRTPYIGVILDSCFAAGAVRTAFAPVRWLEPAGAPRSDRTSRSGESEPWMRSSEDRTDARNWIPPNERCALLSACRSGECACMMEPSYAPGISHGALTYHLCQELVLARAGTTYLDIFERVAPQVTARFPSQHPQLHGARHRELFGVREIRPMRFVPVLERSAKTVVLGGGAVHGLRRNAEWWIYPSGTKQTGPGPERIGRVRVIQVGSATSEAMLLDEHEPGYVQAGARAVLQTPVESEQRLAVEVAPLANTLWDEWLRARIKGSLLLRLPKPGEDWDVRVHLLDPGTAAGPRDPMPQLDEVPELTWAVVARDGSLRMPVRPADSRASVDCLIENLEVWAHYSRVLGIENSRPDEVLRDRIEVVCKRQRPSGSWEPAVRDPRANEIVFEEGEPVALEIRNRSTEPVYIYVLDLGLAGKVELLYPIPGVDDPLEPGEVLSIGERKDEEMPLTLPKEFPFEPSRNGTVEGMEYLKVFALVEPGDFTPLLQDGFRISKHPWTTETRSFLVRRRSASA